MPERTGNSNYFALKKETVKGTAVIPNVYIPMYEEEFITDVALDLNNPMIGNKADVYEALQGLRSHSGEVTFMAEPNTAGYIFDMMMTKGTTTGGGPYTHPFTISNSVDPNSYTVDLCKGQVVHRFTGVEIQEITADFDTNKMMFKCKFAGLKSFIVREVASVSVAAVTFKTNYDPTPTDGLVATDLVRILDVSAGTYQDFTVSSKDSATVVTLSGSPSGIVAGDLLFLRPATPAYVRKEQFMWAKTEFRFADTAANALSAAQTRLEKGSIWTVQHNFANDEGEQRSGSFDPATLARMQSHAEFEFKLFFDKPEDVNRYLTNSKRACVIRHFSETGYELRITLNNLKLSEAPVSSKSGEIVYIEGKMVASYDDADAQQFDIKILNNIATI